MKRFFKSILVVLVMALAVTGISCSQNGNKSGSLSGGNITTGSSADPFANSSWSIASGNSAGTILVFSGTNKATYGGTSIGGITEKGTYTVTKTDSSYTATCKIADADSSSGYTTIKLVIDSFDSTRGEMAIETDYVTVYKL